MIDSSKSFVYNYFITLIIKRKKLLFFSSTEACTVQKWLTNLCIKGNIIGIFSEK